MAYIDTENIPLHMPVPGTREPAQIALLNENCVTLSNHDHTNGKALAVGRLRSGLNANRPAAGSAGNVYFATDTGQFYVDTGTAWVQFITSGGQATVTGWTLIDPIVRDTIQFGPEGGTAIDANLTRVAAGKLVTDGSFGLGGTPPDFNATYRALWIGAQGAFRGSVAGADVGMSVNTRQAPDAKNYAVVAAGASLLSIGAGNVFYYTAPNVAAGAEQTFQERFQVNAATDGTNVAVTSRTKDGGVGYQWFAGPATAGGAASPRWTLSVAGDTSSAPLILYSHGLDGVTFRERMRINTHDGTTWFQGVGGDVTLGAIRTAPTTQAQYFRFWGGVARDAAIYRNPNDDSLRLGFSSNGTSWDSAVELTPLGAGGVLWLGDKNGGGNPAQQRYVRLAYNSPSGNPPNTAATAIELAAPNPNPVGIDYHNPSNAKYGMLYAFGSTAYLGRDIGWGLPNVTVQGANVALYSNAHVLVHPTGTIFGPDADGFCNLGYSTLRWAQIWSTVPSISTSHVSQKHDFAPLDPTACVDAVLNTDWLSFVYNDPPMPALPMEEGDPDREKKEAAQRVVHQKMLEETADSRKANGYVLGSDEYATADLFGTPDRRSASTHSDLAVVACALQSALRRIAELEAKNATAA